MERYLGELLLLVVLGTGAWYLFRRLKRDEEAENGLGIGTGDLDDEDPDDGSNGPEEGWE